MISPKPASSHARNSSVDEPHANEVSPLLQPQSTDNTNKPVDNGLHDDEIPPFGNEYGSRSSWYMFLLTLGGFGLQMGWSVEMSNGSPYLLSLGLNKALLALVWLAGPLSGVIVQPYIGLKSDRCRSKYGKRRPFIIIGAISTMFSLMCLAWAREIVTNTLALFGSEPESTLTSVSVTTFAVIFIYVLDFAINVLQAALRAYAVDCSPHHQQETANAWVSRLMGIGNIFGMFCGGLTLPKVFPFLGSSQFKVLCAIATISIGFTTTISIMSIPERDASLEADSPNSNQNLFSIFRGLWQSLFRLPLQILRVCQVQFLAWIGWFPVLFYTTTYVGEIYAEPFFQRNPDMTKEEIDQVWEEGTRRGTIALLLFAIVTLLTSIILPFFVPPTFKPIVESDVRTSPLLANSNGFSSSANNHTPSALSKFISNAYSKTSSLIALLRIPGLTLRKTWLYSHILFFILMWATLFIDSVPLATTLIALVGIPWGITMWAPFALISAEISKRDAIRRGVIRPPPTLDGAILASGEDDSEDQAGVVLGIHNVSVSAPQVIATIAGSLLFKILQKPRGQPGDNSIAWFFRIGGICTLIAAWWTTKVGEESALGENGVFLRPESDD